MRVVIDPSLGSASAGVGEVKLGLMLFRDPRGLARQREIISCQLIRVVLGDITVGNAAWVAIVNR